MAPGAKSVLVRLVCARRGWDVERLALQRGRPFIGRRRASGRAADIGLRNTLHLPGR